MARAKAQVMLHLKPRELPDGWSIADFTPTSALVPAHLAGGLLVSALRWLTGDRGLPQVAAVYRGLPTRDCELLATVRRGEWYPLRAWEAFLNAADDTLGRGDLAYAESLGRGAAVRDLRGQIDRMTPVPGVPSPYAVLVRALRRWRTDTCSAGGWVMQCDSPGRAVAKLGDLPIGPAFSRFLAGWLAGHVVAGGTRSWMAEITGPSEFVLRPLRVV